jgi:fucose 4-O-acetylase-like acetyltransferase
MSEAVASPVVSAAARRQAAAAPRDVAVDSLRGVAILMVIGIHSLQQPLDSAGAIAVDAALRPAVPLFLFISGYLTARTRRVPLAKRLKAALIPYAIAFLAAYLFMALQNPAMDHRPWVALARFSLGYAFVFYYVPIYVGGTLALWLIFRLCDHGKDAEGRLSFILALAILLGVVAGSYLDPLLNRAGASSALVEEARLRDLPFWFAFMSLGVLVGMTGTSRLLAGMAPTLAGTMAIAWAIYAGVRILSLGDAAAYDSTALFAYASLLCLVGLAVPPRSALLGFVGSGSYFIYLWHYFAILLLREHASWPHAPTASAATWAVTAATSIAALAAVRAVLPPRAAAWLGA